MSGTPDDLHARARAGDGASIKRIMNQHLGLIRHIAKGYRDCLEPDDAFQTGAMALLLAIETYDPAEHPLVRFASYAGPRIRSALYRSIRDRYVVPVESEPVDRADGPAGGLERSERADLIRSAFSALSPAQAEVISALEGLEGPPESIAHLARRLRCSSAIILTIRAAGIAALQAALRGNVAPE